MSEHRTAAPHWGGPLPDPTMARRIARLSGPIIFAMLTQTLVNIADTFFVGQLELSVATPGQAALGYALPLLWSVGGFLSAISVGTQAITARRFGAKQWSEAGGVLTNSVVLAVLTGVVCSILGALACPLAYDLLTQDPEVRALGVPYAQIRMLGVLSMVATASIKSFYDGIGQTHVHMVAAIVMNALNLVLNYCLIFGVWIFPPLGVAGAAWASLISTYVGLAIMIVWTLLPHYRKRYDYINLSRIDRGMLWEITRLSVPSGLATVFVMSGF
ncbi:MAG: MATE family efflux transporter, partial [Myxococcota bacterium]